MRDEIPEVLRQRKAEFAARFPQKPARIALAK
jgi:hypothetical protein